MCSCCGSSHESSPRCAVPAPNFFVTLDCTSSPALCKQCHAGRVIGRVLTCKASEVIYSGFIVQLEGAPQPLGPPSVPLPLMCLSNNIKATKSSLNVDVHGIWHTCRASARDGMGRRKSCMVACLPVLSGFIGQAAFQPSRWGGLASFMCC